MQTNIDIRIDGVGDLEVDPDRQLYQCPYCLLEQDAPKNHGRFADPEIIGHDAHGIKIQWQCEICARYLYLYYAEPMHAKIYEESLI